MTASMELWHRVTVCLVCVVSDLKEGRGYHQAEDLPATEGEDLQGLCVTDAAGRREAEFV